MSVSSLRVEGAAKQFGGLRVFEGISFEVSAGGIMGVIGPNGAGKTTLINCMCGMLSPSAGIIRLGDQDITGKPFHVVSKLGVARSFQQTNTFRSVSRALSEGRGRFPTSGVADARVSTTCRTWTSDAAARRSPTAVTPTAATKNEATTATTTSIRSRVYVGGVGAHI